MAEVTVRWDIRAMNRDVGDIETFEETEFVAALIHQGRVTVVDASLDPESNQLELPFEAEVEKAVAAPKAKKKVTAELDEKLAELDAEGDGDV